MDIEAIQQIKLESDSSDEEQPPQILEFKFEFTDDKLEKKDNKIKANIIMVAIYGVGSLYLESKIKSNKSFSKVGYINFIKAKQQSLANIFKIQQNDFVIVFNSEIKNHLDFNFGQSLFDKFNKTDLKELIVLDSIQQNLLFNVQGQQNFQFTDKEEEKQSVSPYVRLLQTSQAKKQSGSNKSLYPFLEIGNNIQGLSADLLTFSEINSLYSNIFLSVIQDYELSHEIIKVYKDLETQYQFLNSPVNIEDVKAIIKKYNKQKFSTNIYL